MSVTDSLSYLLQYTSKTLDLEFGQKNEPLIIFFHYYIIIWETYPII